MNCHNYYECVHFLYLNYDKCKDYCFTVPKNQNMI